MNKLKRIGQYMLALPCVSAVVSNCSQATAASGRVSSASQDLPEAGYGLLGDLIAELVVIAVVMAIVIIFAARHRMQKDGSGQDGTEKENRD
jgi:hypothetical protein